VAQAKSLLQVNTRTGIFQGKAPPAHCHQQANPHHPKPNTHVAWRDHNTSSATPRRSGKCCEALNSEHPRLLDNMEVRSQLPAANRHREQLQPSTQVSQLASKWHNIEFLCTLTILSDPGLGFSRVYQFHPFGEQCELSLKEMTKALKFDYSGLVDIENLLRSLKADEF
jgi:hypothetical protein